MINLLWISRRKPIKKQIEWLRKKFGGVKIDSRPFDSVDDIVKQAKGFDQVVVVASFSILEQLTKKGIKPLWAEMIKVGTREDSDVEGGGRFFLFKRFHRINRITGTEIEFEKI